MPIWIAIVSLIFIGLLLVIIELIFIPGTTIVGILGFICMLAGISWSFSEFGSPVGWSVTAITALVSAGVVVYTFKIGAWKRFALKQAIDSKVNEDRPIELTVGDRGQARSALRPIGKADFAGSEFEVRSLGELIKTGTKIKIIKLEGRKIFVEPIKK